MNGKVKIRNPIMLALDVDSADTTLQIAQEVGIQVGAIKVGPRLIVQYGAELIRKLSNFAPVFLDHKFFDIPSTMVAAVKAAFESGASFTTVHAWAGPEALKQLSDLEQKLNQTRPFQILCVTVLTSFDQNTLPPLVRDFSLARHVQELTQLTASVGLTGLVCSPHELSLVQSILPQGFLVTPGVRWGQGQTHDQKRTLTPAQAIQGGASALVIGRPILEAQNKFAVIDQVLADLNQVRGAAQ